jgi:hypothetical protein
MRLALAAALALAGCKDTPKRNAGVVAPPSDAIDWDACDAAVRGAARAPLALRPGLLLAGCHVCGSWTPITSWSTPPDKGGPKQGDIEAAMTACNAFCVGDAKLRFMGTLDDARGTGSRMPWKQLAAICKERVSAVPDDRYVDGVYFALDRIARAVNAHGGPLAENLAKIEIPLPAISVTGNGPALPVVPHGVAISWKGTDRQITVAGGAISVGSMPRAFLTKDGVRVDLGPTGYPGKAVTLAELPDVLLGLPAVVLPDGTRPTRPMVMILAPPAVLAATLVPIIDAAGKADVEVYLAARADDAPQGWELPAPVPLELIPGPDLAVTRDMTVQQLVDALVARIPRGSAIVGIHGP